MKHLYRHAQFLALITIAYNIVEGLVSTAMEYSDETLAVFGFGVDSFIESISGVGVYVMIRRIAHSTEQVTVSQQTEFEKQALRITGLVHQRDASALQRRKDINAVASTDDCHAAVCFSASECT